jgi:hypothetical protein|tara:strand:- start:306 stop:689 length:384 start_codon:yes stop_codon:yes gene_type:complete
MQNILSRLEKVKNTGTDRRGRNTWKACCPAHKDGDPSLLITEDPDRALFYCRSGCQQKEILDALYALGLKGSDLNWRSDFKPEKKPEFGDFHKMFIAIVEADIARGNKLCDRDRAIYKDCLQRRAQL